MGVILPVGQMGPFSIHREAPDPTEGHSGLEPRERPGHPTEKPTHSTSCLFPSSVLPPCTSLPCAVPQQDMGVRGHGQTCLSLAARH